MSFKSVLIKEHLHMFKRNKLLLQYDDDVTSPKEKERPCQLFLLTMKYIFVLASEKDKNPEGPDRAKNGRCNGPQVTKMVAKVAKLVAKNDANFALSPRFYQVLIESSL
ncbi:hypothetical protein TNCV_3051431 [Trichonephila clavipes]|nr:hypothetical protein TNCV_3051431 [Trichonephila clavipes]